MSGHSDFYKYNYIYNQNPSPTDSRIEKDNPDVWWNPNRDIGTPPKLNSELDHPKQEYNKTKSFR